MRYVVNFSCGAASAVAGRLTITKHGAAQVLVVNAYIEREHPDNRRFLTDCERWFGVPIVVLRDTKFNADPREVFRRKRYLKGKEGAGIELPLMYRMGYHNANCIGCVKGGAGYWNKIRRDFPEDFEEMARIEETIGPGARLLRHRGGPLKDQRFYLRELDPMTGNYADEPAIECGAACEYGHDLVEFGDLV